jgi:hypothetical protein
MKKLLGRMCERSLMIRLLLQLMKILIGYCEQMGIYIQLIINDRGEYLA